MFILYLGLYKSLDIGDSLVDGRDSPCILFTEFSGLALTYQGTVMGQKYIPSFICINFKDV